jgi:hypothetical protein
MRASQGEFDALVRAFNGEYRKLLDMAASADEDVEPQMARVLTMFDFVVRAHNESRVTFRLPMYPVVFERNEDLSAWDMTEDEMLSAMRLFASGSAAA